MGRALQVAMWFLALMAERRTVVTTGSGGFGRKLPDIP
jgi:hypothetical protein